MNSLHWLVTSTTYGTWLPGDARGFVSRVRDFRSDDDQEAHRREHDAVGTDYDRDVPGLQRVSATAMRGDPVRLTEEQAAAVLTQFRQTAEYRGWQMLAAAVMANHFHLVVTAPDLVLGESLLRDFKSYASRELNAKWSKPASGTWWTQSGSRRLLHDDFAVERAIAYVKNQDFPLAVYVSDPTFSSERKA